MVVDLCFTFCKYYKYPSWVHCQEGSKKGASLFMNSGSQQLEHILIWEGGKYLQSMNSGSPISIMSRWLRSCAVSLERGREKKHCENQKVCCIKTVHIICCVGICVMLMLYVGLWRFGVIWVFDNTRLSHNPHYIWIFRSHIGKCKKDLGLSSLQQKWPRRL